MDRQVKLAAEEFARFVRSSQVMQRFQTAQERYNNDPEVSQLRNEFMSLTRALQQKQYNNTLTQEEIGQYKKLQLTLGSHPIAREFVQAQQEIVELLKACNIGLCEVLGFDFAATAALVASCCLYG